MFEFGNHRWSSVFVVLLICSGAPSILAVEMVFRLSVPDERITIGTLLADEKKVVTLPLQNDLKGRVDIVAIETSCGCAVARPSKTVLLPDESCQIEVRLSPFRRESVFEKTVKVTYRLQANGTTSRANRSLLLRLAGESSNRLTFPTVICRGELGAEPWRFRAVKRDHEKWSNIRVNCPGFLGTTLVDEKSPSTYEIVFEPSSSDAATAMLGKSLAFTCYADTADQKNVELGASVIVVPDRRAFRVAPELAAGVVTRDGASVEFRIIRSADAPDFDASSVVVTDAELRDGLTFNLHRAHERIWKLTVRYNQTHDVHGKRHLTVTTGIPDQVVETSVVAVFPAKNVQD